jgi:ABC-type glycerol-3-phosphate transport system substrate-binding protein
MNALFNTGNLRKSLRLVSITICLLLGLSLLIACSSEPTATPAPPPTPTSSLPFPTQGSYNDFPAPINPKIAALPPFEMKVWFADDYYNQAPITDLITEFQKAYPNIKIKLDHAEWDAMKDKVKQAVKSGNPPDVVHQHSFVLAAQGYAEPLDDLWRQWGGNRIGQFFPGAVEEVSWQASLYGMPLDINAMFLMYNKTMFKDAGLPEPNANYTYTKLLEDAKKLTKADGSVYGIGIHNAPWNTYGLIRSVEGKLLDQVPGQPVSVQLASDQNIQLLGLLSDMVNKYKVSPMPPLSGRYDLVDLFNQRKIAMFFTGPWDLTRVQQEGPPGLYNEVGTAPMPRGFDGKARPGSVQGGGSLFVPKGSKNKEAAFEFMKWSVSPKYQLRLALEMGRYPVLKELYRNQFFTNQPLLQPYLDMLNYSHPYELEAYADGDQIFTQALQAIINKGQDARTVLQASNQQIEKVVKP